MKYANVVIDNNTDATDLCYTYAFKEDDPSNSGLLFQIGRKVKVYFGIHNRPANGYIVEILESKPEGDFKIKNIVELDPNVCLSEEAVRTALWMHRRYLCRYIEALKCFLPISEVKRKTKDPFENIELSSKDADRKDPTKEQADALNSICQNIKNKKHEVILLKGVTGSGKTEVYLQAMETVIAEGRQGIILVPEISLTPQLVARFMSRFGREAVAVLHSKLTPAQRTVEYQRIENGDVKLVIGARSAVFAPFSNIGLIVMDEEHEPSYKSDKSPKYDCLEVATKRAIDHCAVLVLGSATPSVNDYYRASKGIFKLIELKERYNKNPLPEVEIADMSSEVRLGNRSMFSTKLADDIAEALDNKKQVILFLNRRGYSSYVMCRACGFVVKCKECGIAMPYHKGKGLCECHYCGRKTYKPTECPSCHSKIIGGFGIGTEQVEEKAKELFPNAVIERLDLDSIKKKGELESILKRFEKGKIDILIGTQLVAKGLDFANVGLVGVISADTSLNIPDFRSSERSFQLLTQAAGRSGRGDEPGKVVIQTYSPDNKVIQNCINHDFESFFEEEIALRNIAGYPPFSDIFQVMIMDENGDKAMEYSKECAAWLRNALGDDISVLGPTAPMLLKKDGLHRYQLLIKCPSGSRKEISNVLWQLKDKKEKDDKKAAKLLTIDINPFSYN